MHAHRNTATVVAHRKRAVGMDFHRDGVGKTAERFVGGVINHFLTNMGGAFGAGVHARTFFYRLQAFEDGDTGFAVLGGGV